MNNTRLTDAFGRLQDLPRLAPKRGVHQSFIGRVRHEHLGEIDAHLKTLDGKRMANELVAAAAAAVLGVPVPPTFIVQVDSVNLEVQHKVGDKALCLASQLVPGARDLRTTAALVSPAALAQIYAADDWKAVVVLDAWIANSDRTPSNLLQDKAGKLWAIDHDAAFGGDWLPADLVANRHSTNLLARPGCSLPSREAREETLKTWRSNRPRISTNDLVRLPVEAELLTQDETRALSLYLEHRWEALDEVLHHAMFNAH